MNTKLITALRTSANAIERGDIDYNWYSVERCNCGVVACALTGQPPSTLKTPRMGLPTGSNVTWKMIVGRHCPITGMPENEVLRAFFEVGLVQQDIIQLETLSNPKVLERITEKQVRLRVVGHTGRWIFRTPVYESYEVTEPRQLNFRSAQDVVVYMRAWADLLTEQGQMDTVPSQAVTQPESTP